MRSFINKVDSFCYRHPRFGVPNLMLYIVIGSALVWIFSMMDTSGLFLSYLTFSPYYILHGQVWRLVTFVLVPTSSGIWLLIWLYFYYFIGSSLEKEWGSGQFTIYYLSGMLFTVVFGFIVFFLTGISYSITSQYINLSMFFAFATLYPDTRVLLFFFIPIKIKWLAYLDAALFALEVFTGSLPMNLLPLVALVNYFLFCGSWLFDLFGAERTKQRKNSARFKSEVHKIEHDRASRSYNRKCEVCGKTDTDYPDLEFRYCSRCSGYHCYCMEHINNHIHVKE
ncbi:MAG: rhomboid family intramembrane serine protease [Oscillospiraceae bacterium]|nr:rhomboid family intramembrane serine protease [Oscillospiraceae bacterium]